MSGLSDPNASTKLCICVRKFQSQLKHTILDENGIVMPSHVKTRLAIKQRAAKTILENDLLYM